MAKAPAFGSWLEFEHTEPPFSDDSTDDFASVQVRLPAGRRYALDVWTFRFLQRARFRWPYETTSPQAAEYVVAPDLFVECLDRPTLEGVVGQLLADGEMKAGEERYLVMGVSTQGRLLVVAFVERPPRTRIISARLATKRERHDYEEGQD